MLLASICRWFSVSAILQMKPMQHTRRSVAFHSTLKATQRIQTGKKSNNMKICNSECCLAKMLTLHSTCLSCSPKAEGAHPSWRRCCAGSWMPVFGCSSAVGVTDVKMQQLVQKLIPRSDGTLQNARLFCAARVVAAFPLSAESSALHSSSTLPCYRQWQLDSEPLSIVYK